jgi:MFS transporter, PPP family, 3-phenylpropionic acid transporter
VSPSIDFFKFAFLFSLLYAAFGVASPFLPEFLSSHDLGPERLGLTLSLATAIRLISAPVAGRIGDRLHALRIVLGICAAMGGAAAFVFLPAFGFPLLLLVALLHAAVLAPTSILADALALGAATASSNNGFRFDYGWVRGLGSLAFILGSLAAGQAIQAFGIGFIVIAQATLLLAAAVAALFVREISLPRADEWPLGRAENASALDLLRSPSFGWLIIVASLILGSHATHDSFAMIAWNAAGIGPAAGSVLWSESVAAEVIVFVTVGPFLLARLTPEIAMVIAAIASLVRWGLLAESSNIVAIAAAEPLHGFTFALLHLSCMRVLAVIVPRGLAGLAQAIYGTVGIGLTSAVLMLVSGWLYAEFGIRGFWGMFLTALAALPAILRLYQTRRSAMRVHRNAERTTC